MAVSGAPHSARTACAADGSACDGLCDGQTTAACTYPTSDVSRRAASCTGTTATVAASCNGAGACPSITTQDCGAYECGATACLGGCATDGDCTSGNFCNAGVCVAQKNNGDSCGGADQCGSGFCVDGSCCNTACDGQCEACDVSGQAGTCSPVAGAPHGGREICATDSSACGGACDGQTTAACAYPDATVSCRDASCAAGTATLGAQCNGTGLYSRPPNFNLAPRINADPMLAAATVRSTAIAATATFATPAFACRPKPTARAAALPINAAAVFVSTVLLQHRMRRPMRSL